jgi:hypothetical protein
MIEIKSGVSTVTLLNLFCAVCNYTIAIFPSLNTAPEGRKSALEPPVFTVMYADMPVYAGCLYLSSNMTIIFFTGRAR